MKITVQDLMDNAVHFGHKTSRWNPKIKPYLFGKKNDVYLFDLHQTAAKLKEALEFLYREIAQGKIILFVATKPQAGPIVREISNTTGMPFVTEKWLCGLLTNFETIKSRIKYYKKLQDMQKSGEMEKYTKKERSEIAKEMKKLEVMLGGVQNMTKKPDLLFIVDTYRERNAINEAKKLGIKTIGIVDTNADPELIDYPIPANDDAVKSLQYLLGLTREVILTGQKNKPATPAKVQPAKTNDIKKEQKPTEQEVKMPKAVEA